MLFLLYIVLLFYFLDGILTLSQFLDYERVNSYMFTFSVRDDYLDGLAEKTLKVAVTNVNEGNSISASTTAISFTEDTVTFKISQNHMRQVSDYIIITVYTLII
jgi:hypothetical protein